MARKTIKGLEEIIKELEKRLNEYKDIINDRNKQIEQMQGIADNSFENSPTYVQMDKEIEYLKTVIKAHEITIKAKEDSIKGNMNTIQELLKENEELKNKNNSVVHKIKNERGAGRKEMF
ncbi:Hin recombinase, partial [Campylobacter lari]|nr:Hin recombinase [Campylobacter lari]